MARRAGVEIHLNTEITPSLVDKGRPDMVVVATGSLPLNVLFPGIDATRWMFASELLDRNQCLDTPSALVIGGGMVGLETEDFLAAQQKQVTLVEMRDEMETDMDRLAKAMLTKRLDQHGVAIRTRTKIVRFVGNKAIAATDGHEIEFPLGTVALAVGSRPNRALADALARDKWETHVIGDASEPRKALEAIREGFELGQAL